MVEMFEPWGCSVRKWQVAFVRSKVELLLGRAQQGNKCRDLILGENISALLLCDRAVWISSSCYPLPNLFLYRATSVIIYGTQFRSTLNVGWHEKGIAIVMNKHHVQYPPSSAFPQRPQVSQSAMTAVGRGNSQSAHAVFRKRCYAPNFRFFRSSRLNIELLLIFRICLKSNHTIPYHIIPYLSHPHSCGKIPCFLQDVAWFTHLTFTSNPSLTNQ
jgi:hypothetical protein